MSFLGRLRELFTKTQAPVRAPTEELSTEQKTILKDWLEKNALPCTDIKFQRAEPDPAQDPFQSQCGGTPYFEANESWPETAAGEPLDLIAQIWNKEYTSFPAE